MIRCVCTQFAPGRRWPRRRTCPLLDDGITDDTLLHIARFLPAARDLLCLQLAVPASPPRSSLRPAAQRGGASAAAPEMLSIVEEAGRLWVAGCSEQERGWVPRRELESWLGLMHEVAMLRLPLAFGRAHAEVPLSEGGALATRDGDDGNSQATASTVVMRSGRHFAQFTVECDDSSMFFGVIRPGWDVEGGADAEDADGHCFYSTYYGTRFPGHVDWEGTQRAREQGDRIGTILDLDQGSMTVWKNDVQMGVMMAEGLSGPLCWAISTFRQDANVRIESHHACPPCCLK